jgi:hypothetical protein
VPHGSPRGQGISLGEVLEQLRLLFGGQADAGIRDGKLDPVRVERAHVPPTALTLTAL